MTPPKLTDEQKEQLKMAQRSSMRIEETWSLYTMFLSQDKRPHEALERAQEAVTVWSEWMDNNEVQPPEIERPTFAEQMKGVMDGMMSKLGAIPVGAIRVHTEDGQGIDAEFLSDPNDASVPRLASERIESEDK